MDECMKMKNELCMFKEVNIKLSEEIVEMQERIDRYTFSAEYLQSNEE